MLSCRRDRTSHWWADPCADLSGIQGSNVEVYGNEILAKLPGYLRISSDASALPWLSLTHGLLYGLDEILIHCIHFRHLIIRPPFLFLDKEAGSKLFPIIAPFLKKLIITFLFIVENWILGVHTKVVWNSVSDLLSHNLLPFPPLPLKHKSFLFFFIIVCQRRPPMSYPLPYEGGIKGTWFIERNKSTLTQYFPSIIFILPKRMLKLEEVKVTWLQSSRAYIQSPA